MNRTLKNFVALSHYTMAILTYRYTMRTNIVQLTNMWFFFNSSLTDFLNRVKANFVRLTMSWPLHCRRSVSCNKDMAIIVE